MKFALTALALVFVQASPALAAFTCSQTVDPKKTVLFLDTNYSQGEIEAAERAACERGEALITIPDHTKADPDERVSQDSLLKVLSQLASEKRAVISLVVSGHSGGGNFRSKAGGVSRSEIIEAFNTAYKSNPKLLKQLRTVLLWGCYTSTENEILEWKMNMPNIKFLVGFNGKGPSRTNLFGHKILGQALRDEETIAKSCDEKTLYDRLRSLSGIEAVLTGIYVQTCNGEDFYYQNKGKYDGKTYVGEDVEFGPFAGKKNCKKILESIQPLRETLNKYLDGRTPVPMYIAANPNDETIGSGTLRSIYSAARAAQHCVDVNDSMHADRIALLLFYHSIKLNFVRVFGPLIGDAMSELPRLKERVAGMKDEKLKQELTTLVAAVENPEWSPLNYGFQDKSRAQINDDIAALSSLLAAPSFKKVAKDAPKLKELGQKMNAYLYEMRPECMDFLTWLEYLPGEAAPKPGC